MSISQSKTGSVFGGILLIAGSCIGAGMLALPVVTGQGGFLPALLMFLIAWIFMTLTGFLLLEANLTVGHELSLISLVRNTLGKPGKLLCWILFIFLFYSLNIAYIAASGSILQTICADLFGIHLSLWMGSFLFTVICGATLLIGTRPVDYLNRLFMLGLILTYLLLIGLGSLYIHPTYLTESHWEYSLTALPVLIISFGFHNMIPTLALYFQGDKKRLCRTIFIGSSLPLLIYLLWEAIMLGIIPIQGREGLAHALNQGEAATEALRAVVGKAWISTTAQCFAFFAIVTSFLAQSLSLVDFLSDGIRVSKKGGMRLFLVGITLFPPFVFAFLYPNIFIKALNIAGGFVATILFGVLPVLMVWILRKQPGTEKYKILKGGHALLLVILATAIGIFSLQALHL